MPKIWDEDGEEVSDWKTVDTALLIRLRVVLIELQMLNVVAEGLMLTLKQW
jgi:hypothetical protein